MMKILPGKLIQNLECSMSNHEEAGVHMICHASLQKKCYVAFVGNDSYVLFLVVYAGVFD